MPITDFSDYAQPILDQLQDDLQHPTIDPHARPTTFPVDVELEGDLRPLYPNEEDSLQTMGDDIGVSQDDLNAARGAYPMAGIDVLAFYKSFRFKSSPPFSGKWGVFLLDAGIAGLTADLHDLNPKVPIHELQRLAMDLLLAHERYHFWIDAWALGQEVMPLGASSGSIYKRYELYLSAKRKVELTPEDYEESLANHYAFAKLKRRPLSSGGSASSMLRQVLDGAPIPYSDFSFDKHKRAEREGLLAVAVANGTAPYHALAISHFGADASVLSASLRPADRWHPIAGHPLCPVYHVRTHRYSYLLQPFQGPDIVEFKRYVTDYLAGQFLERTDHDYYRIDNMEKVRIPNKHAKTALPWELKGTLLKAGMTHKEFQQERKRTKSWKHHCPRPEPKPPRK